MARVPYQRATIIAPLELELELETVAGIAILITQCPRPCHHSVLEESWAVPLRRATIATPALQEKNWWVLFEDMRKAHIVSVREVSMIMKAIWCLQDNSHPMVLEDSRKASIDIILVIAWKTRRKNNKMRLLHQQFVPLISEGVVAIDKSKWTAIRDPPGCHWVIIEQEAIVEPAVAQAARSAIREPNGKALLTQQEKAAQTIGGVSAECSLKTGQVPVNSIGYLLNRMTAVTRAAVLEFSVVLLNYQDNWMAATTMSKRGNSRKLTQVSDCLVGEAFCRRGAPRNQLRSLALGKSG
jgi:hypothetical protein